MTTIYVVTELNKITGIREVIGVTNGVKDFEALKDFQARNRDKLLGIQGFPLNNFTKLPAYSTTMTFAEQFALEDLEEFLERLQK